MFVLRDCAASQQTGGGGRTTERPDRTSVSEGRVVTSDNVLQVGVVALNQCSQGIFGYVHALRDSLHQVALVKKTHRSVTEQL